MDELNLQVTPECATYLSRLREANRKIHVNVENGDKPDKDNAVEKANALVRQFFQRFGKYISCESAMNASQFHVQDTSLRLRSSSAVSLLLQSRQSR